MGVTVGEGGATGCERAGGSFSVEDFLFLVRAGGILMSGKSDTPSLAKKAEAEKRIYFERRSMGGVAVGRT